MIYIATQAYTRILLCGTVVCTLCIRQAMLWTMQHYASCCLTFTHVEQSLKLLYKSLKGNGSHTFLSLYTITHSRAWYQCLVFSAKPLPRVWLCACSICVTMFLIFNLLLTLCLIFPWMDYQKHGHSLPYAHMTAIILSCQPKALFAHSLRRCTHCI